ncbi:MAG: hypothetical protein L0Y80_00280 [Ignavibacteriae bacterium]|nr:hypothetical protein [Ignavibacteriota bacterium]
MRFSLQHIAMLLLSVIVVQSAAACPVCYADPDSQTSNALSYAVVALLGVTGTVLGGFVGLFVYLRNRAKKMTLNGTVDFPSIN